MLMNKFVLIFVLTILSCSDFCSSEFVLQSGSSKKQSVKNVQEELCRIRGDVMLLFADTAIDMALIQKEFQNDFFAFAYGEKTAILSTKDRSKLDKEYERSLKIYDCLNRFYAELHELL